MNAARNSKLPIGAGAVISLIFHLGLILFVLNLVRPDLALVVPHKKPVVIQLEPPPPPPPPPKPPEPIKPPPPPPPKVPPPPRQVTPPPEQIVTQAQNVPIDVPSAPPPPAPAETPTVGTSVPSSYYSMLQSLVQNALQYPPSSVRAGEEGIAGMRVHFDRSGRILDVEVISASGYLKLDGEAKDVFRRIGRFPPVPASANIGTDEFIIDLPINFKLD